MLDNDEDEPVPSVIESVSDAPVPWLTEEVFSFVVPWLAAAINEVSKRERFLGLVTET